jgi:hypothetical protein
MFAKKSLLLILAAVFVIAGCSSQGDPTQAEKFGQQASAVIRGEISNDLLDFEIAAKVGDGEGDPLPGELLIRGRNMMYDADLGVVTVDLSVYNDSDAALPERVGLTFMQFMPDDVTILNSDNDQNGAGALVVFEFADGDGNWSPGEESQARSVQFQMASGTSFGFVARIDVGLPPEGGTIAGMVWHDMNENGEMDIDEPGVGGITMALHTGDDLTVTPLTTAVTAEDGTYSFEGQDAGYYTVVRMPLEGLVGTTPPEMAVILVEMDGIVSDFLLANFGVVRGEDPGDDFVKVGDFVTAKGVYCAEPDRLLAEIFNVSHCDSLVNKDDGDGDDDDDGDDGDDEDDCDGDCDDGCPQNDCWGLLAGMVTGISFEDHYLEIMGTKVYFHDKDGGWDPDEIRCGIRFRVKATRDADMNDGQVEACGMPHWWNGNRDRVRGYVQEVVRGDDDRITGVIILNTLVELPRDEG